MSDIGLSKHWDILGIGLLVGYLLGSIPFGLIFTRLSGAGDIRQVGSGATGATNVLRTGKYGAAAGTLIFDAAKGAAAVLIAGHFWGETAAAVAAVGAVLGHLFPVWLGFKGGKGVATSLGILLTLYWPVALASLATWLVIAVVTRISSLAALVAAVWLPRFSCSCGEKQVIRGSNDYHRPACAYRSSREHQAVARGHRTAHRKEQVSASRAVRCRATRLAETGARGECRAGHLCQSDCTLPQPYPRFGGSSSPGAAGRR